MLCPKAPVGTPLVGEETRLRFNAEIQVCDWPGNVECGGATKTTKKPTKKPKKTSPPVKKTKSLSVTRGRACIGAKGDKPGTFKVKPGRIKQIKLQHLGGKLTCNKTFAGSDSFWGCSKHFSGYLGIVIADENNKVIFPPKSVVKINRWGFYMWEDPSGTYYTENSKSLIFNFKTPVEVDSKAKKYSIWYGEDFLNIEEGENAGKVCASVVVTYK
jgi:hypothetical protein